MAFFDGRRVFLAGGSEGIGREAALELARRGAHVVIAARRQGPLDDTLAALRAARSDRQFGALSLDATDRAAVRAAVAEAERLAGGEIDLVITNLGAARTGYVQDLQDADLDAMVSLNYLAHANVVRAFLPKMQAARRGDVWVVSSALGFMSMPGYSAYSASKFAIAGFAEALCIELAPQGIRVGVFYPGTTDTPGLKHENESKPKAVWTMESDSAFSKTHQAPDVAKSLLAGIESGRFESFPGLDVWFIWWVYHHFPALARWMAKDEWAKALKKTGAPGPA